MLTKDDLIGLFEKNPRAGKRVVKKLLAEVERKEKLQLLLMRFIIGSLKPKDPLRSALIIQKAWARTLSRMAAENTSTAAGLFKDEVATVPWIQTRGSHPRLKPAAQTRGSNPQLKPAAQTRGSNLRLKPAAQTRG